MDFYSVGQTIAAVRKHGLSMTQEELAERVEITREHLSRIENGYVNPSVSLLWKIASNLGVTMDYLLNSGMESKLSKSLLDDCTDAERSVILNVAHATKKSIRSQFRH